jgi:signal peptidase
VDCLVRIQLTALAAVALALIGAGAAAGGMWLGLLAPAAVVLTVHAQLVARTGPRTWLPALGNTALCAAVAALLLLAAGPMLGAYRTVTVLSGSMQPTFRPGDVVLATPEPASALRVGQVISFRAPLAPHQVETHRVVRILRSGAAPIVQTKGDANTSLDPWKAQLQGGTLWRYRFRVPGLGYPILLLRETWVRRLCVFLLPVLLAVWALVRVWTPPRRLEHA